MEDRRQFGEGAGLADPPRGTKRKRLPQFGRRLRRARQPAGRSGGPGLNRRAPTCRSETKCSGGTTATARILAERRFVRATAPHRPPPGPTALYRTGGAQATEGGSRGHVSFAGVACAAWIKLKERTTCHRSYQFCQESRPDVLWLVQRDGAASVLRCRDRHPASRQAGRFRRTGINTQPDLFARPTA